jgi:hypothetical protein
MFCAAARLASCLKTLEEEVVFMRNKMLACGIAFAVLAASVAVAAPRTERVAFAKGSSSKVIKGTIKGNDYVDYVIGARGGQLLTVNLTSNRGSNYFNVMAKGNDAAYFVGSTAGYSFRGPVPATGDQVIRVYLMRNDARRGVVANYTLKISIVD